jgi:hypothetical protein
MILRFWDQQWHLVLVALALVVVFICSVPAGHALADLGRPTPTPTLPLLDFENDVVQLTPGPARP